MRLKDIHRGYAILTAYGYKKYGRNAYVSNVEPTLDLANQSKSSFERCDRMRYIVIDCNPMHDSLDENIIVKYVIKFLNSLMKENHASDEFKIVEIEPDGYTATVLYTGDMREEIANGIINSKSLIINNIRIEIIAKKADYIKDSRADTLEATLVHIANELYKKKDKFGLGLSQKELDEIIHDIDHSPVFKRLVEQAVRDWIKRQDNLNV